MDVLTHHKLLTALTAYDRREAKKRRHNPYALAHYCQALSHAAKLMEAGRTPREALLGTFCGSLLNLCLKAIGEAPATAGEQRSGSWTREEI